jgi:hypothetical protein
MAYVPANFQLLEEFPIENTVKEFLYINSANDTLATVMASGFISDAAVKRVRQGDLVHVVNNNTGQITYWEMQVIATSYSSAAAASAPSANVGGYANTGTATMALTASAIGMSQANFRNLLDGGDFTINPWQRGTTPSAVTGTTVTYTADRWFVAGATTCSITVTNPTVTTVPGFNSALQFARTSANASTTTLFLGQVIESKDVYRTRGQFVTLSFWALAGANYSPTTAASVQIRTGTTADEAAFTAIGASYAGSVTGYAGGATILNGAFTPTTTWQYFSFTSSVTVGLTVAEMAVLFSMAPVGTAGSADNIQFMGIQLEEGSAPTPFEHRDAQVELEMCQRYCFVLNEPTTNILLATGMCLSATTAQVVVPLPTPMRAAPTVTVTVGSFSVLATTGTAVVLTSAGVPSNGHSVNSIGLVGTAASGLLAGYGTILGGSGGTGKIVANCDY